MRFFNYLAHLQLLEIFVLDLPLHALADELNLPLHAFADEVILPLQDFVVLPPHLPQDALAELLFETAFTVLAVDFAPQFLASIEELSFCGVVLTAFSFFLKNINSPFM